MSGPKISVYALTGWARENVMGQIRCENQSVACAERIKEIIMELDSLSGNFEKQMSNVNMLIKRYAATVARVTKSFFILSFLLRESTSSTLPTIIPCTSCLVNIDIIGAKCYNVYICII